MMSRAGFAESGKECVNQRGVGEPFLSALGAKSKEVFLEAEVGSRVKAVGRALKIGHGVVGRMWTIAQPGRRWREDVEAKKDGDVKSPLVSWDSGETC